MSARQFSIAASASISLSMIAPFSSLPLATIKGNHLFWIANVNLRRPYDGNDPGHSLFEVLGRRFAYSRRQLLANVEFGMSREFFRAGHGPQRRHWPAV